MPLSLVIFDVENFILRIQIHTHYRKSSARTRLRRVQERRYNSKFCIEVYTSTILWLLGAGEREIVQRSLLIELTDV